MKQLELPHMPKPKYKSREQVKRFFNWLIKKLERETL